MPANQPENVSFLEQLHAIKTNSTRALQQLYDVNYPIAEKYILQNNGSVEEAQDIFQEAMIAVWRNIQLDKFIPENESSLKAYLLQVNKNKWISHLRSAAYKKTTSMKENFVVEDIDEMPTYEEHFIKAVGNALNTLGGKCKEVLIDFYYKKRSMRDISTTSGWTEATARNNKYRCIEKLKILLKTQNLESSE